MQIILIKRRDAQMPGTRSPMQPGLVWWCLIFVVLGMELVLCHHSGT